MKETIIIGISDIITDDYGFTYIDLELEDGSLGYFPNSEEILKTFSLGSKVKYREIIEFNKKPKIIGLLHNKKKINKSMVKDVIKDIGEIQLGNNKFFREIITESDVTALAIDDDRGHIADYKVGSVISYDSVKEAKGKNIFVDLKKIDTYNRDVVIARQVAFKEALNAIAIASPKGRYITKDGGIDVDTLVTEVEEITERFLKIINKD